MTIEQIKQELLNENALLECDCVSTLMKDENVTIKCEKCTQLEAISAMCLCGKCRVCLQKLIDRLQLETCTCTFKTIQETITGEDGTSVVVDKQVLDVKCARCIEIDGYKTKLDWYDMFEKAYIPECEWDKCSVVDGVIVQPNNDPIKKTEIEVLRESNSSLLGTTLELDFRVMEIEFIVNENKPMVMMNTMKGSVDMTPYEMMYTLILADNYTRTDFEYKIPIYVKRGRMTQEEADKLIAMMDAKELVPTK